MDPLATLTQLIAHAKAGYRSDATHAALDYRGWLNRGGFPAPAELVAEAVATLNEYSLTLAAKAVAGH
jgi:hypothetical protein